MKLVHYFDVGQGWDNSQSMQWSEDINNDMLITGTQDQETVPPFPDHHVSKNSLHCWNIGVQC